MDQCGLEHSGAICCCIKPSSAFCDCFLTLLNKFNGPQQLFAHPCQLAHSAKQILASLRQTRGDRCAGSCGMTPCEFMVSGEERAAGGCGVDAGGASGGGGPPGGPPAGSAALHAAGTRPGRAAVPSPPAEALRHCWCVLQDTPPAPLLTSSGARETREVGLQALAQYRKHRTLLRLFLAGQTSTPHPLQGVLGTVLPRGSSLLVQGVGACRRRHSAFGTLLCRRKGCGPERGGVCVGGRGGAAGGCAG